MAQLSGHWVSLRSGSVLLWASGWNSPLCTVARNATGAMVQGDSVIVQFRDGRTVQYRITRGGNNAVPVRVLA